MRSQAPGASPGPGFANRTGCVHVTTAAATSCSCLLVHNDLLAHGQHRQVARVRRAHECLTRSTSCMHARHVGRQCVYVHLQRRDVHLHALDASLEVRFADRQICFVLLQICFAWLQSSHAHLQCCFVSMSACSVGFASPSTGAAKSWNTSAMTLCTLAKDACRSTKQFVFRYRTLRLDMKAIRGRSLA